MEYRNLELIDATAETVASFGALIGIGSRDASRATGFYDDSVRLFEAPRFVSDADTCFGLARVRRRPGTVQWMERHFKHTQAFLPLSCEPYVVVVAPPGEGPLPDLAQAQALRFAGHTGFLMHIGTWHEFPFALAKPVDLLVVLRNETNRNLEAIENGEAVGEDLEKRHILTRCAVTLRFDAGEDGDTTESA